jgi:hypothetical protein
LHAPRLGRGTRTTSLRMSTSPTRTLAGSTLSLSETRTAAPRPSRPVMKSVQGARAERRAVRTHIAPRITELQTSAQDSLVRRLAYSRRLPRIAYVSRAINLTPQSSHVHFPCRTSDCARVAAVASVSGCSSPSARLRMPSISRSIRFASVYCPWRESAIARLPVIISVDGCSSPSETPLFALLRLGARPRPPRRPETREWRGTFREYIPL